MKTFSRKRSTLESTLVDKINDAINESNLENSSQYFLKDDFNKTFNTVLYIKKTLKYICRKDLQIYKAAELESTFLELLSSSRKNTIVGCIYRHPSMHSSEFNSIYLNDLLEKLSHENKKVILMSDFNIDLLKYDTHGDSSDFLDAMYASFPFPYINTPSRVTPIPRLSLTTYFPIR